MAQIKDKVVSLEILKVAYDELKEETSQLSGQMEELTKELENDFSQLSEDIKEIKENPTSNVEVDTSLTQSGKAADAKATGEAIRSLRKTKEILKLIGADGNTYEVYIDADGTVKARIYTGDTLTEYTVFVPENVSDEWNTGGTGNSTQAKTLDMTTEEFLELFYDDFVSSPPTDVTVTKKSIGKDQSGLYDMWEYTFEPYEYSRTILLSSGMHTYELSASFGLANFIGHLYTDTDNEAFEYIRKNVRIKVIPIVNPWGFNQNPKTYGNVNGVNPNRNFDLDGQWSTFPIYTPTQNEWNVKGDYPFSEAEVRNLAQWAIDNYNAEFWIDCHTGVGYNDKDLWVYYSSDSVILDRINNAISKIETWFKETYRSDCVTTRTIDNEGSIRLHWAEKIVGLAGMTLEQAPSRTTFGTANNNDSGDISNYSTNISTFVQEFLLDKYGNTDIVPITGITKLGDVTFGEDELSKTVELIMIPSDTTQVHFEWTSSNKAVCEVYGGTNKGVLVKKQSGTAIITLKNRYNNSIVTSFNVSVPVKETYTVTNNLTNVTSSNTVSSIVSGSSYTAKLTPSDGLKISDVSITMGGVDITTSVYNDGDINITNVTGDIIITASAISETAIGADLIAMEAKLGVYKEKNTARITTENIPITTGNINVECTNGYYIKGFLYDSDKHLAGVLGKLATNSFKGTVSNGSMRVLIKKPDGSDFTEEELLAIQLTINGTVYAISKTDIVVENEIVAGVRGISIENGEIIENTARILTDKIYFENANDFEVTCPNGYYIKIFHYNTDGTYKTSFQQGTFDASNVTFDLDITDVKTRGDGKIISMRVLIKKPDGSDFTEEELLAIQLTINGMLFNLVPTTEV